MKIPYGYALIDEEIIVNEEKADVVRSIFGYYLAGASLGKIVDMLYATGILSPSGNPKWGRAAVDKLLANAKYIPIVGVETYYFNSDGELVCFDASLSEICDGLLIRKDYLEQFLVATGLKLFWMCTGEKQFFQGELNQTWKRWEGFIYYEQNQIHGSFEPVEEN